MMHFQAWTAHVFNGILEDGFNYGQGFCRQILRDAHFKFESFTYQIYSGCSISHEWME